MKFLIFLVFSTENKVFMEEISEILRF